jgi:hypothetical protein
LWVVVVCVCVLVMECVCVCDVDVCVGVCEHIFSWVAHQYPHWEDITSVDNLNHLVSFGRIHIRAG